MVRGRERERERTQVSVQDKERKKERKRERGAPCLRFQCFSRATTLSDALVSRSVTKLPNVIHAPLRYVTLRRSAEGENESKRNREKQKRRRTNEIVSVETDTRTKKKEEIRTSRATTLTVTSRVLKNTNLYEQFQPVRISRRPFS